MRALYDLFIAALSGMSAVGSIAGGISQAGQAQDKGQYERDFYEFQARQEAIALQRDLDAQTRESGAVLSRSRAVSASQGGGDNDYLSYLAQGYARERTTLIQDSETKQRMLREKGRMAYKTGQNDANSALMSGIFKSLPSFGSLYTEATKKSS